MGFSVACLAVPFAVEQVAFCIDLLVILVRDSPPVGCLLLSRTQSLSSRAFVSADAIRLTIIMGEEGSGVGFVTGGI